MLDKAHRLTRRTQFAAALRGRRAGTATLVVHLAIAVGDPGPDLGSGPGPPRVGLVVGRSVGKAVVRNQVKRRLRTLARERLDALPGSALLVVRALPAAATASTAELARDLDRALDRALTGTPGGGGPR